MPVVLAPSVCPPDVGLVVGGGGIVCWREGDGPVESDHRSAAGPLGHHVILPIDEAGVDSAGGEGTVLAEGVDWLRHVHGHVDSRRRETMAGHVGFVVPRLVGFN